MLFLIGKDQGLSSAPFSNRPVSISLASPITKQPAIGLRQPAAPSVAPGSSFLPDGFLADTDNQRDGSSPIPNPFGSSSSPSSPIVNAKQFAGTYTFDPETNTHRIRPVKSSPNLVPPGASSDGGQKPHAPLPTSVSSSDLVLGSDSLLQRSAPRRNSLERLRKVAPLETTSSNAYPSSGPKSAPPLPSGQRSESMRSPAIRNNSLRRQPRSSSISGMVPANLKNAPETIPEGNSISFNKSTDSLLSVGMKSEPRRMRNGSLAEVTFSETTSIITSSSSSGSGHGRRISDPSQNFDDSDRDESVINSFVRRFTLSAWRARRLYAHVANGEVHKVCKLLCSQDGPCHGQCILITTGVFTASSSFSQSTGSRLSFSASSASDWPEAQYDDCREWTKNKVVDFSTIINPKTGGSILHVAAEAGDLACVKVLLRHGASVDALDQMNRTPDQVTKSQMIRAAIQERRMQALKRRLSRHRTSSTASYLGISPR